MTDLDDRPSILFVDDEQNVLDAMSRQLRKDYRVNTCAVPHEALTRIESGTRFAVVVSDYTMPRMNGVDLLNRIAARSPDTVRMLLTGNADLSLAIEAVNRGRIFRLLVKPCAQDELRSALDAALEQHRLRTAERELLERTLGGCVQLMADIVSHLCPNAFGRAQRLQAYVRHVGEALNLTPAWQLETAALLSQLGVVALPPDILSRAALPQLLNSDERAIYDAHPNVARSLLKKIPRMETVAEIVGRQARSTVPDAAPAEKLDPRVSIQCEVLRACSHFDDLISTGTPAEEAARRTAALPELPSAVAAAVLALKPIVRKMVTQMERVQGLQSGMVLDEDLRRKDGRLVISRGHEITPTLLERLNSHIALGQLSGKVRVRAPSLGSMSDPPNALSESPTIPTAGGR